MTEQYQSETAKYRHLTSHYCNNGCGIDIASQGDPVVPWAWQLDLPTAEFKHYNSGNEPRSKYQLHGYGHQLPVADGSLDFVYSSHLIEDYPVERWPEIFREWARPLKPGGTLIILTPDSDLWEAALAAGQPPNDAHRHCPKLGEMSEHAKTTGLEVIEERMTNVHEGDYTIMLVARKPFDIPQ